MMGLALSFTLLGSCGYRVGGKADLVPKSIQTIAVPPFAAMTTDYHLSDLLPNAIAHEFTARTRFQVISDDTQADAVLHGTVTRVLRAPALADPVSGKTTTVQIIVFLSVNLVERSTGKVLYSRPNFLARENYEMATDPHQLFDESAPAFDRLSQQLARDIVTSVTENF